jgi:haloalkane dehalogenase
MILGGNAFVERVLPGEIIQKLTDEEMAIYQAPFPTPEDSTSGSSLLAKK